MTDRRDFLKLFGIGAAIVPIIGGLPVGGDVVGKLIEVPKVELVEKPKDWKIAGHNMFHDTPMECKFTDPMTGTTFEMIATTFITSFGYEDIRPYRGLRFRPELELKKATWRLEGQFIANKEGEFLKYLTRLA